MMKFSIGKSARSYDMLPSSAIAKESLKKYADLKVLW